MLVKKILKANNSYSPGFVLSEFWLFGFIRDMGTQKKLSLSFEFELNNQT
jgi:hypothetical protein